MTKQEENITQVDPYNESSSTNPPHKYTQEKQENTNLTGDTRQHDENKEQKYQKV